MSRIKKIEDGIFVTYDGRILISKPKENQYGVFGWQRKWKHLNVGKNGYLNCSVRTRNRKNKILTVHREVAKAFIHNDKNKCCVNHIDGDKLNNNVKNLEWVTHSENNIHSYKNKLSKISDNQKKRISECGKSMRKLTMEQAQEIIKSDLSLSLLAKKYNVGTTTISDIKRGLKYAK